MAEFSIYAIGCLHQGFWEDLSLLLLIVGDGLTVLWPGVVTPVERSVESVSVVWSQFPAVSDLLDEVRVTCGPSTKDDTSTVVAVDILLDDGEVLRVGALDVVTSSEDNTLEDVEDPLVGANNLVVLVRPDTADSWLDDTQVAEAVLLSALLDFTNNVTELGVWRWVQLGTTHTLELGPWGKSASNLVTANSLDDGVKHLEEEAGSVLDGATVLVGSLVAGGLEKLVEEVTVSTVDLDEVETSLDALLSSVGVDLDVLLDLLLGEWGERSVELLGLLLGLLVHVDVQGTLVWDTLLGTLLRQSSTAQVPQLDGEEALVLVDLVNDLLPSVKVLLGVGTWDIVVTTTVLVDEGGLGGDQQTWGLGEVVVVLQHKVGWGVVVSGSETSKRSHHQTVGELDLTDLKRLEEVRFS